jgi:hypothetical protein
MVVGALPLRKFLPRQHMGVDLTPKRFANALKVQDQLANWCALAQNTGEPHVGGSQTLSVRVSGERA